LNNSMIEISLTAGIQAELHALAPSTGSVAAAIAVESAP